MEKLFCDRYLFRQLPLVTARLTYLTKATERCVLGADDGLVDVNITSVTQPDGEVGVFGIVVEFGGTHVWLVVYGCANQWH